jgi:hypothetical protein
MDECTCERGPHLKTQRPPKPSAGSLAPSAGCGGPVRCACACGLGTMCAVPRFPLLLCYLRLGAPRPRLFPAHHRRGSFLATSPCLVIQTTHTPAAAEMKLGHDRVAINSTAGQIGPVSATEEAQALGRRQRSTGGPSLPPPRRCKRAATATAGRAGRGQPRPASRGRRGRARLPDANPSLRRRPARPGPASRRRAPAAGPSGGAGTRCASKRGPTGGSRGGRTGRRRRGKGEEAAGRGGGRRGERGVSAFQARRNGRRLARWHAGGWQGVQNTRKGGQPFQDRVCKRQRRGKRTCGAGACAGASGRSTSPPPRRPSPPPPLRRRSQPNGHRLCAEACLSAVEWPARGCSGGGGGLGSSSGVAPVLRVFEAGWGERGRDCGRHSVPRLPGSRHRSRNVRAGNNRRLGARGGRAQQAPRRGRACKACPRGALT